jgi:hypothetical protein
MIGKASHQVVIFIILFTFSMSFAQAHLTLAGAHESFLTSKDESSSHLDLADFIHFPKLSTVKHYMEDLSELPNLS